MADAIPTHKEYSFTSAGSIPESRAIFFGYRRISKYMGYKNILTDTPDSLLSLEKYLAPIAGHRPIADEYFFQHGGRNTEPTRNIH
jgi:hypothetical protein